MDPGGSELDSSLPQPENPCLIVEDSQPDSVALEDDPESSYRALLARRLSSLQPTSRSPVLVSCKLILELTSEASLEFLLQWLRQFYRAVCMDV